MQQRLLRKGRGWRIGWNPDAELYKGLVGAENWAMELTEAEFEDFCRLLAQLALSMQQMSTELMDQEKIACEAGSDRLWLEVEGFPAAYSLRLLLNEGRRCEGNWTEESTAELWQAVQTFSTF